MDITKNRNLLSASSINGTTVENNRGENIGDIKDLMINTHTGEVEYAVLSVNTGFLNLESKYFAIPMQALTINHEDEKIRVDISKERLENSPGFDKDNWPSGPQHDFVDSVHKYYDVDRTQRYAERYNRQGINNAFTNMGRTKTEMHN